MNKQKEHWEKLAKKNSKYYINSDKGRSISDSDFRESGLKTYTKYILEDKLLQSRDTILDYGCGNGRLTEFMASDFKRVIGLDISETMIKEGKKRLSGFKNVELLEIDGETITLPNSSIDIVFSYLVFQHIKQKDMVINTYRQIFNVLKKGGVFKVLMRSDKQPDMNRWWSGVDFKPEEIKTVYEDIGFKLVKIEALDKFAYWLWLTK